MSSPIRLKIRALSAISLIALAGVVWAVHGPLARAATSGQLQQQIADAQSRIPALSGALHSASQTVGRLDSTISGLEGQIAKTQADLDAKRRELLKLRGELSAARTKLAQLEAFEARAEGVLSQQLIGTYEADRPDIINVVLESTGFSNLLERLSFAQRVRNQDTQIIGQVRADRRAVAAQATRLGALSAHQQQLTVQALNERNRLDAAKLALVGKQLAAIKVRSNKAAQLSSARSQVSSLQDQLNQIQAAQAKAQAAAAGSGSSSGSSAPASGNSSSGGFTFPLPKSSVSPPGTWSLDDGVDMAAPGGTPEYAVCSGTIVLHGIGGFGPSAPVLHCDSPVGGYNYVYYGHAGPGNWTAVGAHVNAGQAISQVGYGIVGISTGPHIEIGFADSSGSPVGPSSASAMLSLLQASFGG